MIFKKNYRFFKKTMPIFQLDFTYFNAYIKCVIIQISKLSIYLSFYLLIYLSIYLSRKATKEKFSQRKRDLDKEKLVTPTIIFRDLRSYLALGNRNLKLGKHSTPSNTLSVMHTVSKIGESHLKENCLSNVFIVSEE